MASAKSLSLLIKVVCRKIYSFSLYRLKQECSHISFFEQLFQACQVADPDPFDVGQEGTKTFLKIGTSVYLEGAIAQPLITTFQTDNFTPPRGRSGEFYGSFNRFRT